MAFKYSEHVIYDHYKRNNGGSGLRLYGGSDVKL